jgi:hypothetical protein
MLDIFNSQGGIRDIDPAEVETLSDPERDTLMATLAAVRAAEEADAHVNATRAKVRDLMNAETKAIELNNAANPPLTHKEALMAASQAAALGDAYKPSPRNGSKKTRDALAAVTAELIEARAELIKAETASKAKRSAQGSAVVAWCAMQPRVSAEQLVRDHVAAGQKRLADEKAGLVEPPKVEERVNLNPIDALYSARGRSVRR